MAIDPGDVAAVLLAAGQSRRFGADDKLLHPFRGKPLVLHIARTLAALPFRGIVAVADNAVSLILPPGIRSIANPDAGLGLSSSIGVGIAALDDMQAKACLIVLADMPLLPADHFLRMMRAFDAEDPFAIVATRSASGRPVVPALFGHGRFGELRALSGDHGARAMLVGAPTVSCDPTLLMDFDEPSDFAQ